MHRKISNNTFAGSYDGKNSVGFAAYLGVEDDMIRFGVLVNSYCHITIKKTTCLEAGRFVGK